MITRNQLIKNAAEHSGLNIKETSELLFAVEGNVERFLHAIEDIKRGGNYSLIKNIYSKQLIRFQ